MQLCGGPCCHSNVTAHQLCFPADQGFGSRCSSMRPFVTLTIVWRCRVRTFSEVAPSVTHAAHNRGLSVWEAFTPPGSTRLGSGGAWVEHAGETTPTHSQWITFFPISLQMVLLVCKSPETLAVFVRFPT